MPEDDQMFKNVMKTVLLVETGILVADVVNDLVEDHYDHDED
jgi:hypothetical protein